VSESTISYQTGEGDDGRDGDRALTGGGERRGYDVAAPP
jgi:hypothetical protein